MAVEIQELGPCKKKLSFSITREEVGKELDKHYRDVRRTVTLPGFRPGKVPRKLLERRFGGEIATMARDGLIKRLLGEAIEEHGFDPIGEPQLEVTSFDPKADPAFVFEVVLQLRPEFELPDLSGIKVEKPAVEVSEQDVDEALNALRKSRGKLVDRPEGETVQAGDLVVTDLEFVADGEVKHTEEGLSVWPENNRIGPVEVADLAERFAGKTVGETLEIPTSFPEQLGIEGEQPLLRVHIKAIRTIETPALDAAFAKDVGFSSVEELRDELRKGMVRQREQRAEQEVTEAVIDAVLERVDFELPEDLVEEELDELARRAQLDAQLKGMSEEQAQLEAGKVRTASRDEVRKRLKATFLLEKVAKEKRLFATEDEVARRVVEMAQRGGRDPEQFYNELVRTGAMSRLRYVIRLDKAREYLRAKAEMEQEAAAPA